MFHGECMSAGSTTCRSTGSRICTYVRSNVVCHLALPAAALEFRFCHFRAVPYGRLCIDINGAFAKVSVAFFQRPYANEFDGVAFPVPMGHGSHVAPPCIAVGHQSDLERRVDVQLRDDAVASLRTPWLQMIVPELRPSHVFQGLYVAQGQGVWRKSLPPRRNPAAWYRRP